eukprot:692709-Prymnesium_polylepis.1
MRGAASQQKKSRTNLKRWMLANGGGASRGRGSNRSRCVREARTVVLDPQSSNQAIREALTVVLDPLSSNQAISEALTV